MKLVTYIKAACVLFVLISQGCIIHLLASIACCLYHINTNVSVLFDEVNRIPHITRYVGGES